MRRVLGGVRAALHMLLLVVLTIVGAILAVASAPFDKSGDAVVVLARAWSSALLWTAGVRVDVRLAAPLDVARPYVFMANHMSAVDIWALFVALPVSIRFIAKKQLGRIPLFGWAMAAGRFIFIDRENPVAARRSIDVARDRIRGGQSVAIFPEGTRSRDGRLGPFKKGGFHLAIAAGVPIIPVAIRGAFEIMPAGQLYLTPGVVTVEIGAPISTEGLQAADRGELLARVSAEIARMTGQPRQEPPEVAPPPP